MKILNKERTKWCLGKFISLVSVLVRVFFCATKIQKKQYETTYSQKIFTVAADWGGDCI